MTLNELDRLAAEKVMGWFVEHTALCEDRSPEFPRYFIMPLENWQPTRNISQAFECLEKLADDRWLFTIYDGAQDKSCVVYKYSESFHAYGETASEAIVRACLAARGVEL